jgi:hypothetical protein
MFSTSDIYLFNLNLPYFMRYHKCINSSYSFSYTIDSILESRGVLLLDMCFSLCLLPKIEWLAIKYQSSFLCFLKLFYSDISELCFWNAKISVLSNED